MLVVQVFVNNKSLAEIWIQNTSVKKGNAVLYKIIKLNSFEKHDIWHVRNQGFEPLLRKVLKILEKERIKNG